MLQHRQPAHLGEVVVEDPAQGLDHPRVVPSRPRRRAPAGDAHALPAEQLEAERADWVVKRSLGRVGDQVFVGALHPPHEWRQILAGLATSRGESWVAQRFVRQQPVATPWGEQYVTLGAYLLDGVFAGYFARLSPESHVSHEALVVPVFVEDE